MSRYISFIDLIVYFCISSTSLSIFSLLPIIYKLTSSNMTLNSYVASLSIYFIERSSIAFFLLMKTALYSWAFIVSEWFFMDLIFATYPLKSSKVISRILLKYSFIFGSYDDSFENVERLLLIFSASD